MLSEVFNQEISDQNKWYATIIVKSLVNHL